MKSITLGLALSLLGGVALAQTPPPAPTLKPPATGPATLPAPPAPGAVPQGASPPPPPPVAGAVPAPSGPPEGMIVETPNGFYLVRPGESNPQRLDLGRGGPGRPGLDHPPMDRNGPDAMAEDGDAMGDMGQGGLRPPPPRPHRPPPHPPEGKGAHLRIHTPNLDVDVKCPDEEPIKACVDAVSQLMDKANASAH